MTRIIIIGDDHIIGGNMLQHYLYFLKKNEKRIEKRIEDRVLSKIYMDKL